MDERLVLDEIRRHREKWQKLHLSDAVRDLPPSNASREDREECLRSLFKQIEGFAGEEVVLRALLERVKDIPSFESRVEELKREVAAEKEKNETVDTLMDSLERLKKECDAQVALAKSAAASQASVDYELSLNQFTEQKEEAMQSLKKLEREIAGASQQRDEIVRIFKEKEGEYELTQAMRNNQLDALRTELGESELILRNLENERKDIEDSGVVRRAESLCKEKCAQLNALTEEIAMIEAEISKREKENEIRCTSLSQTIEELKDKIAALEELIEELPSPLEWEKSQRKVSALQNLSKLEEERDSLSREVLEIENERLSLANSLSSLTAKLADMKLEKERIQGTISSIVRSASSNSELVQLLQSQCQMLESSMAKYQTEIQNFRDANLSKRQEKETWEQDVEQVRRNVRNLGYDPENPVIRHATPSTKPPSDLLEHPVMRCYVSNQSLRLGTVLYIIVIHALIYIISHGKFLK